MKTGHIILIAISTILIYRQVSSQIDNHTTNPCSDIQFKHAKSRLKAIAREFMIEKQKIKSPFELHQNWKFIKNDIYKILRSHASQDKYGQLVVDESVIPKMTTFIFKKLEDLQSCKQDSKHKKYISPSNQISMQDAIKILHRIMRQNDVIKEDKPILLKEIMIELKKYKTSESLVDRIIVENISEFMVKKFKKHKSDISNQSTPGYLEHFIADSYKKRFENQLKEQDWAMPH